MVSPLARRLPERPGPFRTTSLDPLCRVVARRTGRRSRGRTLAFPVLGLLLILTAAAGLAVVSGAVPVRPLLPVAVVLVLALAGLAVEARARPAAADHAADGGPGRRLTDEAVDDRLDDAGAYYYDGPGRPRAIDDAF